MKRWFSTLRTMFQLGVPEVLYVVWYRFSLRVGIRKFFFPVEKNNLGKELFEYPIREEVPYLFDESSLVKESKDLIIGYFPYYSKHNKDIGTPPNWFLNPFNGRVHPKPEDHWTKISDFNADYGDIKNLWEASRFGWAPTLVRTYMVTGDPSYITTCNDYVKDWLINNPLNQGPNWKCGQEAAIRVFNLLTAYHISGSDISTNSVLPDIINTHLKRIHDNIRYAFAQNNNHGTSEAAALFIGGSWLYSVAPEKYPQAKKYADRGGSWLEERVNKLIAKDGGFSQYSVNYHRVLLDTMIFVEFWRQELNKQKFSANYYSKIEMAIDWLFSFVDHDSGNAPNFGANDGTMLLNLHSCDYTDFRPTLQTANVIFKRRSLFKPGPWDEPLYWLGLPIPNLIVHQKNNDRGVFNSGYLKMSGESSWALLRIPVYKFRPSHNDAFHFDLWLNGENILFDSGSYSYNQNKNETPTNLKSVHCHNTVSFNGDEQMPQLSRFLLGQWLHADKISEVTQAEGVSLWEGQYKTTTGYTHQRSIKITNYVWWIEDELRGPFNYATIGFNFYDPNYIQKEKKSLETKNMRISVNSECVIQVKKSHRSIYYQQLEEIFRMEIVVRKPGRYITKIELKI
jgi:hypothetical protein